jgi:hypothetical protein
LDLKEFDAMEDMFHIHVKDEIFGEDLLECFATEILDAKYEKTDVAEVVKGLTHLNAHQKKICFKCYRKTIRYSKEPLEFIHTKRYTLTLIQMPSLYILSHTLNLKVI